VLPLVIAVAGACVTLTGALVLRSFGPGLRLGRLLAVTQIVGIDEARAIAAAGEPRFVGVEGRIDSTDDFPDENQRPLVYRSVRLEVRGSGRWRTVEDSRHAVPFALDAGMTSIGIDVDVLGPGLVVLARESTGLVGEIPERFPDGTPPSLRARMRIEQVSSVEHATALGRPVIGPDGAPRISAGLGRPLVLSTLERDDAMRVLAEGRRGRAVAATALLVAGPLLVFAGVAAALPGFLG
jgi:hypothetical protein